jgi:hypothetical protein
MMTLILSTPQLGLLALAIPDMNCVPHTSWASILRTGIESSLVQGHEAVLAFLVAAYDLVVS